MVKLIEIHEICKGDEMVTKLQEWGLVPKEGEYPCPKCGNQMYIGTKQDCPEGVRWRCNAKIKRSAKHAPIDCNTVVQFRKGTFFERAHLNMFQILAFAHHWANRLPLTYIMRELDISSKTAVDWASFCREVLLNAYLSSPHKLGGENRTVEIDESKFGKRKYHRGHKVDGAWVFGGVERESGRVFMEVVEKRDSATLLPLIRKWILPGTRIISDCWKAYKDLDEYQHLTVNHSISFVDEESGEHTNTIESTWRHAKESMGSHNRKKAHIPGNLARYMFLKAVRAKKGDYAEEFYRLAGKVYNPANIEVELEVEEEELDDEDIDLFE